MTLSTGQLISEEENRLGRIVFSHPKGNSLTKDMMMGLAELIKDFGENSKISAIILESAGDSAFCGGASFDELRTLENEIAAEEFFLGFGHIILAMFRCPKPIVTLVQGKAVGGGLGLICASDYVLASKDASLRLSEAAIGIGPFVISPALERKMGNAHFAAMTYDTEWRDANWAKNLGIYQQVFQTNIELRNTGKKFALDLAAKPLAALSELKALFINDTENLTLDDFRRLAKHSAQLLFSDETQAFLQSQ